MVGGCWEGGDEKALRCVVVKQARLDHPPDRHASSPPCTTHPHTHTNRLYSRLDSRYEPLVSAVEADLLRLFLVTAHNARRPDKMAEFFRLVGPQLISNSSSRANSSQGPPPAAADWREWFLLPYLQHPDKEPHFQVGGKSGWLGCRGWKASICCCLGVE